MGFIDQHQQRITCHSYQSVTIDTAEKITKKAPASWEELWYDQTNFISYCKNTWEFYLTKNKNSLAPQWYKIPTRDICWCLWNFIHMLLVLYWALSNCLWPLWDSFHAFKIKVTCTPHIVHMLTSTLEVTQKHASHPHKNTPSLWCDSSIFIIKVWAMQKKKEKIYISMLKSIIKSD